MTKTLKAAIAAVERMPSSDQELIGRQVLQQIEKLRDLRDDIDEGLHALAVGEGRDIDINSVLNERRDVDERDTDQL